PHESFIGTYTNQSSYDGSVRTSWRPDTGYFLFIGGGALALVSIAAFLNATKEDALPPRRPPGGVAAVPLSPHRVQRLADADRPVRDTRNGPPEPSPSTPDDDDFIAHPMDERGFDHGRPPAYAPPEDERYFDDASFDDGPSDDR
ncbi:MAG: hypothetical protein L0Z54_04100, partial [Thermoplasmata archaeon]|nr:hypothetical protein [Thermoplasmata archaeon]